MCDHGSRQLFRSMMRPRWQRTRGVRLTLPALTSTTGLVTHTRVTLKASPSRRTFGATVWAAFVRAPRRCKFRSDSVSKTAACSANYRNGVAAGGIHGYGDGPRAHARGRDARVGVLRRAGAHGRPPRGGCSSTASPSSKPMGRCASSRSRTGGNHKPTRGRHEDRWKRCPISRLGLRISTTDGRPATRFGPARGLAGRRSSLAGYGQVRLVAFLAIVSWQNVV